MLRAIIVLLAAAMAFALGRWTATPTAGPPSESRPIATSISPPEPTPSTKEAVELPPIDPPTPAPPQPSHTEMVLAEVEAIADAARSMATPDAHTYAFFEELKVEDLDGIVGFIESLPSGNEQDALYLLAMQRWAQLDPAAALARAESFPSLGTRVEARTTIFQEWATFDADSALLMAADEVDEGALRRAVSAVLVGAVTSGPENAFSLLELAPVRFLKSPAVLPTVERMVQAAYGTGRREALQTVIERMKPGDVRTLMIDTLARNWSAHFPDEAYAWVRKLLPDGDVRDKVVQNLFTAIAFKDPSRAAQWVAQEVEEPNRTKYLAAAVSQWAQLDLRGVEIWLNEQPEGFSTDGGSLALAGHFMKERHMARAFSWIRRINQNEMRIKMFGDLGRLWSEERPAEFQRFLDETSLNRAEVELLTAEVKPSS